MMTEEIVLSEPVAPLNTAQFLAEARRRLLETEENGPLSRVNTHWFMQILLPRRWRWEDRVGDPGLCSVKGLYRVKPPRGEGVALMAAFMDGSSKLVSWRKAAELPKHPRLVDAAMRHEISWQLAPFRKDGCHVHHEIPFAQIARGWLGEMRLTSEQVKLESALDGQGRRFSDRALAESWKAYHQKHAKLVSLSIDEHKSVHYGE